MNPYEVLEISVGASAEEIKAAYHGMAKKWHPDRFTGPAKLEAEQRFRMLAEAYSLVKDVPGREAPAVKAAPPVPVQTIQLDQGSPEHGPARTVEDWYQDAKAAAAANANEKALGLIQYAIRLDPQRGEFHALLGRLLDQTGGDKRATVRSLETALRLNPKDVESAILLAQTFQALGMHARASRLWNVVRNLAPNHPIFSPGPGQSSKRKAGGDGPGMGEQLSALVAEAKETLSRLFKRG